MLRKVFGIISYFPDADTEYRKHVRNQRIKRFTELLTTLSCLWSDIDILVIAQNWKDYQPPKITNKLHIVRSCIKKLGITSARRVLRAEFLESDYDYLIMLDDDVILKCNNPQAYIQEIEDHPNGIGVIRHNGNPMVMLAISKYIYSQIDLPDLDVERGQGFEGDVFVARCFAQFPERAFDFNTDIKDLSVSDYLLPSTWTAKSQYEQNYMSFVTDALVLAATHPKYADDTNEIQDIDVVIPYVDCTDPNWINSYQDATHDTKFAPNRYRSWGTLPYLLRGIEKYMPFVRDVVLIVANETQVPNWINQDQVRIVYHRDFIPVEYLPTFNSCTIEAFLFSITKLSDRFIYFNDDIFPINYMVVSDFFTGDLPHLRFREHLTYVKWQIFNQQCRTSMDLVSNMLKIDSYPQDELISPEHTAMPILRSTVNQVYSECSAAINASISPLREAKNINQYIYHYYQFHTGLYINDICPYLYAELNDDMSYICNTISDPREFRLICLNDMGGLTDADKTKRELTRIFNKVFPDKCKYEI